MNPAGHSSALSTPILALALGAFFCRSASAVTVAADGSGDYPTVQTAIDAAPTLADKAPPFLIHIKPGTYHEKLTIPIEKGPITFEGDDSTTTVLTYGDSARTVGANGQEIGTSKSASILIQSPDFHAENITFENSAGPVGQAVAVNVWSDRAVFRHCRFLGWQDTLFVNRNRQYFEDCFISGHVDFIFGASTAWFERCELTLRGAGYLTAASTPAEHTYGLVFSHCRITASSSHGAPPTFATFLGRPWRPYASVTFLNTEMAGIVRPEGWSNWNNPDNEKTARYAEYKGSGLGANPAKRVAWSKRLDDAGAKAINLETVFGDWLPSPK